MIGLYTQETQSERIRNPATRAVRKPTCWDVEVDFILEPEPFSPEVQQLSVKDPSRTWLSSRQDRLFRAERMGSIVTIKSDKAKNDDIIAYWLGL